jgi:hypothetical protein
MAESPISPGIELVEAEAQARREFLKKVGAASAMVPAVSVLLAANFKAGAAQTQDPYGGGGCGTGCGSGSGSS